MGFAAFCFRSADIPEPAALGAQELAPMEQVAICDDHRDGVRLVWRIARMAVARHGSSSRLILPIANFSESRAKRDIRMQSCEQDARGKPRFNCASRLRLTANYGRLSPAANVRDLGASPNSDVSLELFIQEPTLYGLLMQARVPSRPLDSQYSRDRLF